VGFRHDGTFGAMNDPHKIQKGVKEKKGLLISTNVGGREVTPSHILKEGGSLRGGVVNPPDFESFLPNRYPLIWKRKSAWEKGGDRETMAVIGVERNRKRRDKKEKGPINFGGRNLGAIPDGGEKKS